MDGGIFTRLSMKPVIQVENLSKRYRIGLKEEQSTTLAGRIGNIIKAPFKNLKNLRNMNRFGVEDESVFWALKDINFQVNEGEVLGIIGKNGAGKSTLLKILSQITEPTSGKIEIHGRVASLLEVGTGFHPELSGRDNIYMNGTILGMTRREIDSKLDEIIDFSGVEKFLDTAVKFYSSGMKVRLGFSVAAHLDPEILIIDEVLAVGDYEFQSKCLGKMEDVASKGRTVIFVSHNMQAVSTLTNRSLVLNSGVINYIGNTESAINEYILTHSQRNTFYISNNSEDYIQSVLLKTSHGNNIQKHGEKWEIEISICNAINVLDAAVSFKVFDTNGVSIFHELFIASENGSNFKSEIKLRSIIENIKLFPGHYSCSIYFADRKSKVLLEKKENVCPFSIEVMGEVRDYYWVPGDAKYVENSVWEIL